MGVPEAHSTSSIPAGCMQDAVYRILDTGYRMALGCRMADVMGMHGLTKSLPAWWPPYRGLVDLAWIFSNRIEKLLAYSVLN